MENFVQRCATHNLDAKKIADLAGRDEQCCTRSKADDYAVRDEINQRTHARQP